MVTLNDQQVAEFRRLHKENMEALNNVIGGKTDIKNPKPITEPNASCLVSHSIANQIMMLSIINKGETK